MYHKIQLYSLLETM